MPRYRPTFILLLFLGVVAGCQRGPVPQMIGQEAPLFRVVDSDRTVRLQDLRGKVVVLNFWATWCPPCVEEMPSLLAMQKRMAEKVVVLAVSTDENERAYQDFIRDYGLSPAMVTVRDADQSSNALYGTFKFPETYIIDRHGVLRRKFIGPVDWSRPEIIEYLDQVYAAGPGTDVQAGTSKPDAAQPE